jgi:hypothetical protein
MEMPYLPGMDEANLKVDELEFGTITACLCPGGIVGSRKVVYHWKVYGGVPPVAFAVNSTGWFTPVVLHHG